MKKSIILLSILFVIACSEDKSKYISGDWVQTSVYISKSDSISFNSHLTFHKNGNIMENKYKFWGKYKMKRNKFYFMNGDSIISTFDITEANEKKFIIEANLKMKSNQKDTVVYRKLVFKKTKPYDSKPYDSLLTNLAKQFDFGKPDTSGDGALFISFTPQKYINNEFTFDDPYKTEPKIKGIFDKTIGALPKREELHKYSPWEKAIFNVYEWETLDYKVTMENYFRNRNDKSSLYVKIWLIDK